MRRQINGILLLDKSAGVTSNAALQRVKYLFHAKKAGHTGSLDPIATGMLPICFGSATKLAPYLLESDKSYHVTARLGVCTTTGDTEGDVTETRPVQNITGALIKEVMARFMGEIEQVPPMFSAIKVKGQPLYKLARKGVEIERKPRQVNILSLSLETWQDNLFTFTVHCSKGTYIRTLVEEMGNGLGCGAHVVALRRITVSSYADMPMYTLSALEALRETGGIQALDACLLSIETAVQAFPVVKLSNTSVFYLRMGQPVRVNVSCQHTLVRLISDDARFLGIGEILPDGRVKPHRLLSGHGAVRVGA